MREERNQRQDAKHEQNRVNDCPARNCDYEQHNSDYQPEHRTSLSSVGVRRLGYPHTATPRLRSGLEGAVQKFAQLALSRWLRGIPQLAPPERAADDVVERLLLDPDLFEAAYAR
jgi:hypothetical protein